MSNQDMYISANLIKIGNEKIVVDGSKALSLNTKSISTDNGVKFSIPSSGGLSLQGQGIYIENKNSNQTQTVFSKNNNIAKNKDIIMFIPPGISVSGILPDPPTNIVVEPFQSSEIESSVKITFTPPQFTGGSPILSYTAVVSYDDKKTPSSNITHQSVSSTTSIIFNGLTTANTYKFKVYSTNSTGNSDLSNESNFILAATVPNKPTISSVTIEEEGKVRLFFLDPHWTGGVQINSYKVYIYNNNNFVKYILINDTDIKLENTNKYVIISEIENNTLYTFSISAINVVGEGNKSDKSNILGFYKLNNIINIDSDVKSMDVILVAGGAAGMRGGGWRRTWLGGGGGGGGGAGEVKRKMYTFNNGSNYSFSFNIGLGGIEEKNGNNSTFTLNENSQTIDTIISLGGQIGTVGLKAGTRGIGGINGGGGGISNGMDGTDANDSLPVPQCLGIGGDGGVYDDKIKCGRGGKGGRAAYPQPWGYFDGNGVYVGFDNPSPGIINYLETEEPYTGAHPGSDGCLMISLNK